MKRALTSLLVVVCLLFFSSGPVMAKSVNFRANPLGLVIGLIDATIDIRITDNLTLGPTGLYWNFDLLGSSFNATGYGVRGNYFFNKTFEDGWYVGPFAGALTFTIKQTISDVTYEASSSGSYYGAYLGYGWFWNMFNIMLGAGYFGTSVPSTLTSTTNGTTTEITAPSGSTGGLGLEFSFGLAF